MFKRTIVRETNEPGTYTAYSIIFYVLDVIEVILGLRLIFKLLAANPNNGFTNFLYTLSAPLVAPFAGIFRTPVVAGAVLEWSTIVAMVIYALLAWLVVRLMRSTVAYT